VRGTWSVLEAVRTSASVQQVVLASSDKAYGAQPALPYDESMPLLAVEPYDASKACAETIARSYAGAYGVPLTITRCANFYGPGDRNWRRIVPGTLLSILRGDAPIIRSDGSLVRDYLYVKDGVSAYLRLAEAMVADPALIGQAFNFSAEEPLTVLQMVDRIQAAAGTSIEPIVEGRAVGEIQEQHLSARKARELLAWQPAYTLDEGLLETVAYYRRVVADEGAVVG
jgi:CDP-glucose 4,6-dehydratase